jgi:ADP-ribosylglycohydrolase
MSSPELFDRAYGCLVGGAIGDALGAPVEGLTRAEIATQHGRVSDFLSDDPIGTDDTDYAVFNALIILEHGRDATSTDVEANWRRDLLAPTAHFRRGGFSDVFAARNLSWGLHAPRSGAFNQQLWSDGVAMAIGAAGIACSGHPAAAARLAAAIGAVSNGRDGIYAGQAVAASVAVALAGASVNDMLEAAVSHIPADSWTARSLRRAVAAAQTGSADAVHDACVVEWFPWADIAPEAVALAFGALVLGDDDFRRTALIGVNFGRDADTIGAISGILAGARLGASAIPEEWRSKVRTASGVCLGAVAGVEIQDVARRLVERFGGDARADAP